MILERESEMAALGAATREAGDGAGSVVLVFGEAGIGKSSLVEAIRGVLLAEGRLLVGYCDDLAALAVLDALGAEPLARLVRARLKSLGAARIPRGPTPTTRVNPAGLTERQLEVVRLLAQGLTNAEIAGQLVLSVRTVDSHVAAALEKLGAHTRREAVARAGDLGVLEPQR